MVTLRTPRRSLCFSPPVALSSSVSSISKFRGAIPKVEAWLPSRPKHLDPCGVASVACSSLWITLTTAISEAGVKTLKAALQAVRERQVEIIPIWTVSHNAAEAIAHAAKELDVDTVLIGESRRSAFYHMLRGHALKGPTKKLPRDCHLMICN